MAKRGMVPQVAGVTPMEASDLVHEESSYIAKQLALRATVSGKNVIWDITMSSRESTEKRINELRAARYSRVEGIFVDIPVEVSIRRSDARHREGHDGYRAGHGQGGRFVPAEVISSQADPEWGSRNRKTFEQVKPQLDAWSRCDNSVDGRAPVLAECGGRKEDNR
jgi:Zeta toxin